jgi:hypothetical protein
MDPPRHHLSEDRHTQEQSAQVRHDPFEQIDPLAGVGGRKSELNLVGWQLPACGSNESEIIADHFSAQVRAGPGTGVQASTPTSRDASRPTHR